MKFEMPQIEEEVAIDALLEEIKEFQLIVYNDDVNTFDHVISCLIKICKHDAIQAEQCAIIVHYKGKCAVKSGEYSTLEPLCTALLERGINAEIE